MNDQNLNENLGYKDSYRTHSAIANSDLRYLHSPKLFKAYKEGLIEKPEPKSYQEIGMLFEDFAFQLDNESFYNKYIVQPEHMSAPESKNQKNFVYYIVIQKTSVEEAYLNSFKVSESAQKTGKYKEKAQALYNSLKDYIEFEKKAEEKKVISAKDFNKIKQMFLNLAEDEAFKRMTEKATEIKKSLVLGTEEPVTIFGIPWKGELDIVYLDHKDKIAYLCDIKTTSTPLGYFQYDIVRYKYYRQLALYRMLLQNHIGEEWTILTRIIAAETTGMHETAVIPIPHDVLKKGEEELSEAADTIRWYRENGWEKRKSQVQNEGLLIYNWDELNMMKNED